MTKQADACFGNKDVHCARYASLSRNASAQCQCRTMLKHIVFLVNSAHNAIDAAGLHLMPPLRCVTVPADRASASAVSFAASAAARSACARTSAGRSSCTVHIGVEQKIAIISMHLSHPFLYGLFDIAGYGQPSQSCAQVISIAAVLLYLGLKPHRQQIRRFNLWHCHWRCRLCRLIIIVAL